MPAEVPGGEGGKGEGNNCRGPRRNRDLLVYSHLTKVVVFAKCFSLLYKLNEFVRHH